MYPINYVVVTRWRLTQRVVKRTPVYPIPGVPYYMRPHVGSQGWRFSTYLFPIHQTYPTDHVNRTTPFLFRKFFSRISVFLLRLNIIAPTKPVYILYNFIIFAVVSGSLESINHSGENDKIQHESWIEKFQPHIQTAVRDLHQSYG